MEVFNYSSEQIKYRHHERHSLRKNTNNFLRVPEIHTTKKKCTRCNMAFYKKKAIVLYISSILETPKRQSQLLFQPIWIFQEILKNSSDICFFQAEILENSWKKYRLFLKSLCCKMDEIQIFCTTFSQFSLFTKELQNTAEMKSIAL